MYIENKLVVTSGEKEGGRDKLGIAVKRYKLLCRKYISYKEGDILYSTGEIANIL